MTLSPFPQLLGVGLGALLALLASCSERRAAGPDTALSNAACPGCNVVLVSMDTVRADHLGCYGYSRDTSPSVDQLAAGSALFEQAVSQSPWTLPAHGSIMTGLQPRVLGVVRYPATRRLPLSARMLAEEFKDAGYATGAFTGGGFVSAHFGFARGFDVYQADGRRFEHNMDGALDWLRLNQDRPFFLFLHGYNAHRPYYSTSADRRALGFGDISRRESKGFCGREKRERPANLDAIVSLYDASVRGGDRHVGRFLDELDKLGLADRTVVLVTSDHGEEFFEHGNCDHVRFVYAEVVNVPWVLRVPGLTDHGPRIKEPVPASISVPSTLLELVGVEHSMPGPSLVGLLGTGAIDTASNWSTETPIYSEAGSAAGKLGSRGAVIAERRGSQKLVRYTDEDSNEAYDLGVDPGELNALPSRHDVYSWAAGLDEWAEAKQPIDGKGQGHRNKAAESDGEGSDDIPEELKQKLRDLGYVDP
jgi:arylsulfatase A-like enzyme